MLERGPKRAVDPDKKFGGALRIVGATNPRPIAEIITSYPEAKWDEHTFRQTIYPEATHKYTKTVFVKYRGHGMNLFDEEIFERLRPHLRLFRRTFRNYYEVDRVPIRRIIFTKLEAGRGIPKHRDSGKFLEHHRRIHIPIVTHPDVEFLAGNDWHHLSAGTMYELNNQRAHAVRNPTDVDRIHMIVDIETEPKE